MSRGKISYFDKIGRKNVKSVIKCVKTRVEIGDIKTVLIFAATKESVNQLRDSLDKKIEVCAVTFPCSQSFLNADGTDEDGKFEFIIPETSQKAVAEELRSSGIPVIQCSLPLDEILIPGVPDTRTRLIKRTLDLISQGLTLCINAAISACDCGVVQVGEKVIAMSADTAVVVRCAHKSLIFHPDDGLRIFEILCKPY